MSLHAFSEEIMTIANTPMLISQLVICVEKKLHKNELAKSGNADLDGFLIIN